MEDQKINQDNEELEPEYLTLTDEEGNDILFEVIGQYEKDGRQYFAMIPAEDEEEDNDVLEYVILKLEKDGNEEILVTVDDEEELDDIADYFDDLFTREIDYDD